MIKMISGGIFSISGAKNPKMNQALIHQCLFLETLNTIITKIRKLTLNPSTWFALEDQQWLEFVPLSTKGGGQSCTCCITIAYTYCNSLSSLVFKTFSSSV